MAGSLEPLELPLILARFTTTCTLTLTLKTARPLCVAVTIDYGWLVLLSIPAR